MKIKKLFIGIGLPYCCVIQLLDGSFAKFFISPFRNITEKDLSIIYYIPSGKHKEEAPEYLYHLYGFEKQRDGI